MSYIYITFTTTNATNMKNLFTHIIKLPITACLVILMVSCTKEYDCTDKQLQPVFIHFQPAEIETFTLRKYTAGENFRNLLDTFVVRVGYNAYYQVRQDTTIVFIPDGSHGIKPGYDWQLFIPSRQRTILVSEIKSERTTGKRGYGLFSMDPGPTCENRVFSAKVNTQLVTFPLLDTARPFIYIY